MGQCAAQTFTGITEVQFNQLAEKARANGIPLDGPSGTAEKMGIVVTWNYSAVSSTLTIQCTHVPFFISCNDVNLRIRSLVDGVLNQPAPTPPSPEE